jgi:uncharacterized protein
MSRAEIRYLQIPTTDEGASAAFYEHALGWKVRTRADGSTGFDDSTGDVSGEWVRDRSPAGDAGVLVYIRVEHVEATLERIVAAGGEVVVPRSQEGDDLVYATFRDPSGNVLGVFQAGDT